jgi:transcription factor TGA
MFLIDFLQSEHVSHESMEPYRSDQEAHKPADKVMKLLSSLSD